MDRIDREPRQSHVHPSVGHREAIAEFLRECGQLRPLAERAADEPTYNRYKRMEAAWRALAVEQDWLNGEID